MNWLKQSTHKKLIAPKPGEVNYSAIDRFTFVHFAIGMAYGFVGLNFYLMAFLGIGWEIIENPLKYRAKFLFPHATADTWQNLIMDTVAVFVGWGASRIVGSI